MKMTIKAEFTPGTEILEAFTEAIRVSKLLDCFIEFKFNGITCIAFHHDLPDIGVENYHKALSANARYCVATN